MCPTRPPPKPNQRVIKNSWGREANEKRERSKGEPKNSREKQGTRQEPLLLKAVSDGAWPSATKDHQWGRQLPNCLKVMLLEDFDRRPAYQVANLPSTHIPKERKRRGNFTQVMGPGKGPRITHPDEPTQIPPKLIDGKIQQGHRVNEQFG